jgi:ABC-type lipoprotein release transport system permease subunit
MVNQSFVHQYFPTKDALGQLLSTGRDAKRTKIIGIVKDSPNLDLTERIEPEIYLDFEQTTLTPFLTGLVVRTKANPNSLAGSLRRTLALTDAEQPVVQVKTLETLIAENLWQPRFAAWFAFIFAAAAACLCGVGIYGVVAYVTAARRRDFGIRAALGAERRDLLTLAAVESLAPVLLGACLGLFAFYWTGRWISSLLYKTSPLNGWNALTGAGILLAISLAAVSGPAARIASIDPALSLREE